jgi:hypothetical protein
VEIYAINLSVPEHREEIVLIRECSEPRLISEMTRPLL